MMKIKILAIGKEKSKALQSLIDEYLKRIPWQVSIYEYTCNKKLPTEQLKEEEGKLLLSHVEAGYSIVVLDEQGIQPSSIELTGLLKKYAEQRNKIVFLIGGAHGHADLVKQKADVLLSLSNLTFPHKIVRLILVEQLYRLHTIAGNHPYHKV